VRVVARFHTAEQFHLFGVYKRKRTFVFVGNQNNGIALCGRILKKQENRNDCSYQEQTGSWRAGFVFEHSIVSFN
jgi:hypothetical protein